MKDAEPHKIADFRCNNLNLAGGGFIATMTKITEL